MRKLYITIFIFVYITSFIDVKGQENEPQSFMFDSLMNLMLNKSIPFKYVNGRRWEVFKEFFVLGKGRLYYSLLQFNEDYNRYVQNSKAKYDQFTKIKKIYELNYLLYVGVGVLLLVIFSLFIFIFIFVHKQWIVRTELQEAILISQIEKEKNKTLIKKINESEQRYKLLMSDNKLEKVNSYLEGLEFERSRLSKELHDNTANNILSVIFLLQSQNNLEISDISHLLEDIHEQVRKISHELIPPEFKYTSFTEILKDYVNKQNNYNKIKISLSVDSKKEINKIPEKIKLELYRIIQECINNSFKHSNASNIEILLYVKYKKLNMTIVDNGNGFDLDNSRNGIGLFIIKERVKSFNGVIEINSTVGKGTEIEIVVHLVE